MNKQDAADRDRADSEGMGQPQAQSSTKRAKKKDPAAVALGRKGGLKGGHARAAKLTPDERAEKRSESCAGTLGNQKAGY